MSLLILFFPRMFPGFPVLIQHVGMVFVPFRLGTDAVDEIEKIGIAYRDKSRMALLLEVAGFLGEELAVAHLHALP